MTNLENNCGYQVYWDNLYVDYREGYYTSVVDFHQHDFYEINLIRSGNVKILLKDRIEQGIRCRLVLTRPGTPHYILCKPDTLYSRAYLLFSNQFIADYVPEWKQLLTVFGKNGQIITLTDEQKDFYETLIKNIHAENDLFRQRLLILYLLSHISQFTSQDEQTYAKSPPYIMDALTYISEHYAEKIVAEELAKNLHISRTTLLTAFKKYTGNTLNNYLINYRLKKAVYWLRDGKTLQETAEICGFSDSSTLARSFKRYFGVSSRLYLSRKNCDDMSGH
ncbi:MAG: helix-turn-helix transcriptional regulator [Lachnospiraceae bacterium]|nr:helix-turn-helix transcriptional regulator [Lachnospiraceae bacterium]